MVFLKHVLMNTLERLVCIFQTTVTTMGEGNNMVEQESIF